jgi:hypothetical protein
MNRKNYCSQFSPEALRIEAEADDGKKLAGHFSFLLESDYEMEIDSPFSGLHHGLHTPYFAMGIRPYYVRRDQETGRLIIHNRTIESGRCSLLYIYRRAKIFLENIEILRGEYIALKIKNKKREIQSAYEAFLSRRLIIRKGLREGMISSKDYEREIRTLREKEGRLLQEKFELIDRFSQYFRKKCGNDLGADEELIEHFFRME